MNLIGLHWIDLLLIALYFIITLYIGVIKGGKRTRTLGDFFVAGSRWGPVISFIFVFTSAVAGNEAVVVSGQAYEGGLSGVWYWWSFLFATPVYFMYSTYFRRARVYNISEMLELRYDKYVSSLYSIISGFIGILWIGMFLLAIGKILTGMVNIPVSWCVWIIAVIVIAYVYTGGLMSTLLNDIFQGLLVLIFLSFIMLPFLWKEAGGLDALRDYSHHNPNIWSLVDPAGMNIWTIMALNLSAIMGGIATPWMYNYIAVSKNELAATQCGWGHLWKRIITLVFALYGILFAIYKPGLEDPERAWGIVMNEILPVGALGLMIISFLAAAMSSAGNYATSCSAVLSNYFYRKIVNTNKPGKHYLLAGRITAISAILIAAFSTGAIGSIKDYVKLSMTFMSFIGIPLHFGIIWKKSNIRGMWCSLIAGIAGYLFVVAIVMIKKQLGFFEAITPSFEWAVFVSAAMSVLGMWLGSKYGPSLDAVKLNKFYLIMNTPVGQEKRLVDAGIKLPALIDAGLTDDSPEKIKLDKLNQYYNSDSRDKIFGKESDIELRREKSLPWYYPGILKITIACFILIFATWLITKWLFIW